MLTKIFIIYAVFCAVCFLYLFATTITIGWDIHRDNPNFKPQSNKAAAIASLLKMVVISVLPIINVGILFVCLFYYEELKEKFKQTLF